MTTLSLAGPGSAQATRYLNGCKLHAGSGSSLKKIRRALRIAAGLRPLTYRTSKTFVQVIARDQHGAATAVSVTRADLHPTKGFRDVRHQIARV